mgnify:CR=1 FL=1
MSELTVGILGFVCIIAIVITLFKSKTMPSMAFIIFPSILGLILVLGGYYTIGEIGDLIKGGFKSTDRSPVCVLCPVLRNHDRCRYV